MVSAPYDLNRCCNPDAPTAARVRVRTASSLSQPPPVNKACDRVWRHSRPGCAFPAIATGIIRFQRTRQAGMQARSS